MAHTVAMNVAEHPVSFYMSDLYGRGTYPHGRRMAAVPPGIVSLFQALTGQRIKYSLPERLLIFVSKDYFP